METSIKNTIKQVVKAHFVSNEELPQGGGDPIRYLIDCGRKSGTNDGYDPNYENNGNPASPFIWNLFGVLDFSSPIPIGTALTNIVDVDNNPSAINLEVTTAFTILGTQGGDGPTGVNNTEMIYHYAATRDQFYANSGSVGVVTISGLDDGKLYDLKAFGSRVWSVYITRFTIGAIVIDIDCKNNVGVTADFINISPVGGQIILQVETANATKGTLNVIELIQK